jgi:glyoxylase-like metal-dependent hydrolase (beta-lactamase superfamily II)
MTKTMERRNFLKTTALTAASFALLNKKGFAAMIDDPQQFRLLRNNVGMFAEKGGTIAWMINKEGIVVVDAEFPEQADHLIALLKKQSDLPFEWLINTHHHGDHTSGNISFKGIVKNVAAHENSLANQKNVAIKNKTEDKQLYPDTTFTEKWKIKVGDERITAHYFGTGHTDGDAMIHFEHANIVHAGDLVFNRRYPFVDNSAGASVQHWPVALEKARKKFDKDTIFIFGHAHDPLKVVGNMDDIIAMQNFMEKLEDYVAAGVKAGKTKEEILKTSSIPGITEWQGDGIERGITAAYEELTKA